MNLVGTVPTSLFPLHTLKLGVKNTLAWNFHQIMIEVEHPKTWGNILIEPLKLTGPLISLMDFGCSWVSINKGNIE